MVSEAVSQLLAVLSSKFFYYFIDIKMYSLDLNDVTVILGSLYRIALSNLSFNCLNIVTYP